MKNLILSAIFAVVAFTSNAQIIIVDIFEVQDSIIYDNNTKISSHRQILVNYTFNLITHIATRTSNGQTRVDGITIYSDTNNLITLVYTDFASSGFTIDINNSRVTYFEIRKDSYYYCNAKKLNLFKS